MVKLILPHNLPDVEMVFDSLIKNKYIEISNPVLTRKVGYYIKPITDVKLVRIFQGRSDGCGSLIMCKSRLITKKVGKGGSLEYMFSNERIKVPRF